MGVTSAAGIGRKQVNRMLRSPTGAGAGAGVDARPLAESWSAPN